MSEKKATRHHHQKFRSSLFSPFFPRFFSLCFSVQHAAVIKRLWIIFHILRYRFALSHEVPFGIIWIIAKKKSFILIFLFYLVLKTRRNLLCERKSRQIFSSSCTTQKPKHSNWCIFVSFSTVFQPWREYFKRNFLTILS